MKIVFLTNKNHTGFQILKRLKESNIVVDTILIETPLPIAKSDKFVYCLRTATPGYLLNFFRRLRGIDIIQAWEKNSSYKMFSDNIIFVENFNSGITESILKEIAPDIIILGGTRIIKNNIIKIPKIGILNSHPGLLPKYRGVDVIPWAILNDDEIGVSVHFINEGVDTGAICRKKIIEIEDSDTIKSLRNKAAELSANLMADVVKEILQNGVIDTIENSRAEGKQYYKINKKFLIQAEEKLKKNRKNKAIF